MECPECKCQHIRKNGKNKQHKQKYICVSCSRQFILDYETHKGYSDELRKECLMMYVNGMGLRAIDRVKKIHHTTVIHWLKQVAQLLPNAYESQGNPQVGELDELETFVAKKTQNMDLDGSKSL